MRPKRAVRRRGQRRRGHLIQRAEGSWTIVFDLEPVMDPATGRFKRRQKSVTVRGTQKEAQEKLTDYLKKRDSDDFIEEPGKAKQTVGDFLRRWLEHAKATVRGYTWERYRVIVERYLIPDLGARPLTKLTPLAIQAAYDGWRTGGSRRRPGRGLSARTIRQHHAVLHRALGQAVKWGLVGRNVADAVEPPQVTRHEVQPLDEAGTARLLKVAQGTRWELPVVLAAATGLRRGEVFGLKWTDIDLEARTLTVRRAVEQTPKGEVLFKPTKSEKARVVTLPLLAVAALRRHRAAQADKRLKAGPEWQDNDLVLALADGRPWPPVAFMSGFRSWARRNGFKSLRFHDLRHGHATHLLRAGVPLKVVSARLGHGTVAITGDLYQHVLAGMDEQAADALDAALQREGIEA